MTTWYGVVDAAQDPRLRAEIARTERHVCLFGGQLHPAVADAAPYLVDLDAAPDFSGLWRQHGWGRHWGLVCRSPLPLDDLRRRFRRFLLTRLPDGTVAMFRFYDPRVFAAYLPTARGAELAGWFDGIDEYLVAAADGVGTHRLTLAGDALRAEPPLPG